jgi:predicted RNA-binding protein with PUA-like domain
LTELVEVSPAGKIISTRQNPLNQNECQPTQPAGLRSGGFTGSLSVTTWLLKTEPTVYSFDDLLRDGTTTWDGVTNPTALKHLRSMKKGDTAIIYHTGVEKAAVGLATITADATVDTANTPIVKLKAGKRLPKPVTLAQVKADKTFADLPIVRIPRLSVMPLPDAAAKHLLAMANAK